MSAGDKLLTDALSGRATRVPLTREVAELNIRLAAQLAALDTGWCAAVEMLRRAMEEIEAAHWPAKGSR